MSKHNVSFSFVMPAYKSTYIGKAIESIVNQTVPNWDLTIIDDFSPEDLETIVGKYQDDRIRYIRNDVNIGRQDLVAQWNHSLSFAKGEWIVLAADDDEYLPAFLEKVQELITKYPQVNLIRSRVEQIDENGKHLYDDGLFSEFSSKEQYLQDWLTGKAFTCIGNYVFRRTALEAIGGFANYPCGFGSDIETPIKLSVNGVANTYEMLFRFRQSSQHLSADKSRFIEKLNGITKLSVFLRSLDYQAPGYNNNYLQSKCIYDYFNLVIKHLSFKDLGYLQYCTFASPIEKGIMILRWVKYHLMTTIK